MNYLENTPLLLSILAVLIALISLATSLSLKKLRKIFFAGKDANQLEDFIVRQNKKITDLTERADYIEEAIFTLQEAQKVTIQRIGLTRFNSFSDSGGNLSFSMALLDAKGNGVVVTSMHGREQNRIYSKPVIQGKSDIGLTEEEQKAVSSAILFQDQNLELNNK